MGAVITIVSTIGACPGQLFKTAPNVSARLHCQQVGIDRLLSTPTMLG